MNTIGDLNGKVVLITGGANGIGAAMVRAFAAQHANVFFCDVDEARGKELELEIGLPGSFAKVDLAAEQEIKIWIKGIGSRGEKISVLINNAAIDPRIPLSTMTVAQWDHLFDRNLKSGFLTIRETVPWMTSGASIINFASITFHNGPINMSAYVATKGGVIGFTRALARELGPKRIRVNTISPGWIMTERQLRDFVTEGTEEMIKRTQCIPELLQPEEIADVALFLASDLSRAMTGQELLADRGWNYS